MSKPTRVARRVPFALLLLALIVCLGTLGANAATAAIQHTSTSVAAKQAVQAAQAKSKAKSPKARSHRAGKYKAKKYRAKAKSTRASARRARPKSQPNENTGPTASPTASPTTAATATPTPTPSPTASPTPTATSSPTVTATSTPTVSPTAAPTTSAPATPEYPDASTTGARGILNPASGTTITTAGVTISNVAYTGTVTINADNVTLRNVSVSATSYYGILVNAKNITLQDVTITGVATTMAGLAAGNNGSFKAYRLDVSKVEDGVRLGSNSELRDSFVHDLNGTADSHFDAVGADYATNFVIDHNTILNPYSQTSAIYVGDGRSASSGVISNNYLAGGGYILYAGPGPSLSVVNNLFSTKYFSKGGYWGAVAYWYSAGNVWSGNKWADGTNKLTTVTP